MPPLYADTVIHDISNSLETKGFHKVFDALYGAECTVALSDAHRSLLEQVIRQAYDWNRKVKSEVVLLDYHPQIEVNDDHWITGRWFCWKSRGFLFSRRTSFVL